MDKTASLPQVEGAALQNKAYTEATCAAITQAVAKKQDTLTGTAGQVVGFDADGNAVAGLVPPSKRIEFSKPTDTDLTNLLPNTISPRIDLGFTPGVGAVNKITGYYFLNQDGTKAQLYIGEPTSDDTAATKKYVDDVVVGVLPPGGTTGQALVKVSDADGDVKWGMQYLQ